MLDFLFNPLYLNLLILALLIFLVFFFWRKLTILEGNFYILEKRVNLIKKDTRESNVLKNANTSNEAMNCIFGNCSSEKCKKPDTCNLQFDNNCKKEQCIKNVENDISLELSKDNNLHIEEINEITEIIGIIDTTDDNLKPSDDVKIVFNPVNLDKKIEESIESININDVITTKKDDIEHDNVSITSDITFNTEDKYTLKKLSKMNHDKLKEVCLQLNISHDGTKAQLISRILENNK
jgi:hypothetical protein